MLYIAVSSVNNYVIGYVIASKSLTTRRRATYNCVRATRGRWWGDRDYWSKWWRQTQSERQEWQTAQQHRLPRVW